MYQEAGTLSRSGLQQYATRLPLESSLGRLFGLVDLGGQERSQTLVFFVMVDWVNVLQMLVRKQLLIKDIGESLMSLTYLMKDPTCTSTTKVLQELVVSNATGT